MGGLSPVHWAIVLLIVVLVFGTKKLRNIGQDLGGAIKGFKQGMSEGTTDAAADKNPELTAKAGQTVEGEVKEKTKS